MHDQNFERRKNRTVRFSDEQIVEMVDRFYEGVKKHPRLGPIFNNSIGDNWHVHLPKMYRFWSSVLNTSGVYSGNPMAVHMNLQQHVEPSDFSHWLELFRATLDELFTKDEADFIYLKAENIAKSLSLGMFFNPASPHHMPELRQT
ncbi:group III truncated hemoglobin [Sneathiella glossodoripedis]|uniref:group III truncated hemoglobin n=1 Tax=Sneathiella glossodoripedis TaxID=418853 RepID=UPI000471E6F4|nr:group III truncated hemoglobin [Sneathiella glossodoripedis]